VEALPYGRAAERYVIVECGREVDAIDCGLS